jgi:Icc-related predicted phosphoesterase
MSDTNVVLCGDSHGEWDALFRKLEYLQLEDCVLLHCGDIGIGFKSPDKQHKEIEFVNNRFKKRNIQFMGIAGNHDHREYFQGQVNLSHFELLPDYTYREFNGERFLFVGGAVSIDRRLRVPNVSWWEDEAFVLKPELVEKVDVLITHSCPPWIGDFQKSGISGWCEKDPTLWEECQKERTDISKLIELSQPKNHYCGHMHTSLTTIHNGCKSKILDILEIVEHRCVS